MSTCKHTLVGTANQRLRGRSWGIYPWGLGISSAGSGLFGGVGDDWLGMELWVFLHGLFLSLSALGIRVLFYGCRYGLGDVTVWVFSALLFGGRIYTHLREYCAAGLWEEGEKRIFEVSTERDTCF